MLPVNAAAVRLFTSCGTQWRRHGPSGALTGLDYSACQRVAEALEIDWRAEFARLAILESEVINVVNQRIDSRSKQRHG